MNTATLEQRIHAQRELVPSMYGQVDFAVVPERFTQDLADRSTLPTHLTRKRAELLADTDRVAKLRAYTMLGDSVADAYAALLPEYGAKRLIAMLQQACARGLEQVPDAPPELVAFISQMERMPAWLDRALIERGARKQRNVHAHVSPYAIRGAFFATFVNKYSALPMAITGALTSTTAARRVWETATFFGTSVLPGALDRYGAGFRAAAMVRMMHSMVRFNILTHRTDWNVATHGIPIPQVDQMPAGLINVFILSREVMRQGRDYFNPDERAIVELARYRCFLLGLPEELLGDTPRDVLDMWLTRAATLRAGFDDATCGALIRATVEAELSHDHSRLGRLRIRMENSFSKLFFIRQFANGDRAEAARMGIEVSLVDYAWEAVTIAWIMSHVFAYECADRIPVVRDIADDMLVGKIVKQLEDYGPAEYTTRSDKYRAVQPSAAH